MSCRKCGNNSCSCNRNYVQIKHIVGQNGTNGWSPIFEFVPYGDNILKKLTGYIGGTGTMPTANVGLYVAENSYTSNIEAALNFKGELGNPGVEGPKGEIGPKGDKGDTGQTGEKGVKGDQGIQGIQGPKGDTGLQGPIGNPGPAGEDGVQGVDGQSAYEIAVSEGFPGSEEDFVEMMLSLHYEEDDLDSSSNPNKIFSVFRMSFLPDPGTYTYRSGDWYLITDGSERNLYIVNPLGMPELFSSRTAVTTIVSTEPPSGVAPDGAEWIMYKD